MASFTVRCPYCQQELECEPEWIGMEAECPSCQKSFVISNNENAEETVDLEESAASMEEVSNPPVETPAVESISDDESIPQSNADPSEGKKLRKNAERCINKWFASIPGGEDLRIDQMLDFKQVSICELYTLRSELNIKSRSFKLFESPYKNEKLPDTPLTPGENDFWRFEADTEKQFTLPIPETFEKITCHTCHGKKRVSCPECHGHKEVVCPKCNGSGDVLCDLCIGSGQVDRGHKESVRKTCTWCDGKGYRVSGEICTHCHGKGCNYEDQWISDWYTCPRCNGSKTLTCRTCGGSGEVPCDHCRATGLVTCLLCEGNGNLKCGYKLIQQISQETHYDLWSPETSFPLDRLSNAKELNDLGETLFHQSFNDIQRSLPDGVAEAGQRPLSQLLQKLGEAYPEQMFRRFKSHELNFTRIQFIRWYGTDETAGNEYCFWVEPKTGIVIDESGFLNDLTDNIIIESDAEEDPVKSMRLAAKAFVVNQDLKNRIPSKLLLAKYEQFYSYLRGSVAMGLLTGLVAVYCLISQKNDPDVLGMVIFSPILLFFIVLGFNKSFLRNIICCICRHCGNIKDSILLSFLFGLFFIFPFQVLWIPILGLFINGRITEQKKYSYLNSPIERFKKGKKTLNAFSPSFCFMIISTVLAACPLAAWICFMPGAKIGPNVYWACGCLLAGFILNFIIAMKKVKNTKPVVCADVLQKGLNIGPWADRSDVAPWDDIYPYCAVIVSANKDKARGILETLNHMVDAFGPFSGHKCYESKIQVLNPPQVAASAESPELLTEVVKSLKAAGAEVKIVNKKNDCSKDFAKANPSVQNGPGDKDHPYMIYLHNMGKNPAEFCGLLFKMTGSVISPDDFKEPKDKILFSAPSGDVLKNIVKDFRDAGVGVSIVTSEDIEQDYRVMLISAGNNPEAVLELAGNYVSGEIKLPMCLIPLTIRDDAETVKKIFEDLGAEISIWSNKVDVGIKKENNCWLICSDLGNDPATIGRLCGLDDYSKLKNALPQGIFSSSSFEHLSERVKCFRKAGAKVWCMKGKNISDTFQVLLLRTGENREQVQALVKSCSINKQARNDDELIPPVEILKHVLKEDAQLCQHYFAEIGAKTAIIGNVVLSGRDHDFRLIISSPGKTPEAVAALINTLYNQSQSVEEIFKDNLTPIADAKCVNDLIGFRDALLEYGASAWIMDRDDTHEVYDFNITRIPDLTDQIKKLINFNSWSQLKVADGQVKLPKSIAVSLIPSEADRYEAAFKDSGVELLRLRTLVAVPKDAKTVYELTVFDRGDDPDHFDIVAKCCVNYQHKEKKKENRESLREDDIPGRPLPYVVCSAESAELLISRRDCLLKAGGSAWICTRSEGQQTYKVIVTSFGNEPEKLSKLVKKYAFNSQFWQGKTPAPPVVVMKHLVKIDAILCSSIFKEAGAEVCYLVEETDKEAKIPYSMMVTSLGEKRDTSLALLDAWEIPEAELEKISSGTPICIFQTEKEEDLRQRLELFRKAGMSAWICKPKDPQKTIKVVLNSYGPNKEQVVALLKKFPCGNSEDGFQAQDETMEIIRNLTRESALECAAMFQKLGADVNCLNSLGEVIS